MGDVGTGADSYLPPCGWCQRPQSGYCIGLGLCHWVPGTTEPGKELKEPKPNLQAGQRPGNEALESNSMLESGPVEEAGEGRGKQ